MADKGTIDTVLGRVIKEVPNMENSMGVFPVIDPKTQEISDIAIAYRALEILETPHEIKQFMEQYSSLISQNHGIPMDKARKRADYLVGYATTHVDEKRAYRWFMALPSISHPILGRDCANGSAKEASTYLIFAECAPDARKQLLDELRQRLSKTPFQFSFDVKEGGNGAYMVYQLELKSRGDCRDKDILMFLYGSMHGMRSCFNGKLGVVWVEPLSRMQ